jgi:tRNA uridine 5-carboxymethylaminomethyl modification enzyme
VKVPFVYPKKYDVIVVGAGHAGVEAALVAARMGCDTLLLTTNLDTIAQMSCNPAIGGLAKGHLVREIDALGGEMGVNTDLTGIQFRMLNTKKGPAVRAPRAQCDKKAYQFRMKAVVERQDKLDVKQALIESLRVSDGYVTGVITKTDVIFQGTAVVVTTGTFLRGLIHIGSSRISAGRSAEPSAESLSGNLRDLGFEIGRLKTGTPPRLNRKSIDFSKVDIQHGDRTPSFFSHRTPRLFHVEQIPCYVTYTSDKTKEAIRSNLHLSAMYSGQISGVGPRYCPSIEDKIVKFPEKERHQIFLEPEGRETEEFYVNGASTSMPEEVQLEIVRSIIGLETAELMRPAYAIEYDYALPHQLHTSLETKLVKNLFFAGQINGTSGYEEAAAQGMVAGINAALGVRGKRQLILTRADSYIGVLIDDLVTKGADEPYRMFTSRAEYRLQLRQDNADLRLMPIARELGLVDDARWGEFTDKRTAIDREIERLKTIFIDGTSCADRLRRPEVHYSDIPAADLTLPKDVQEQVEIRLKYEGYISRDLEQIQKLKKLEEKKLPASMDYSKIAALSFESRQRLQRFRPDSIGQASRLAGVTPADIAVLLVWLKKSAA